jgi:uncharacterized C2H2 Zn-finger protein
MDAYRDAGARPRVYSDRESTPNFDRCQETEIAHPNRYRTSHTPREDYQHFDDDYLPSGVTRRRSRVRFRSPHGDDAFAEYPMSRQTIKPATYDGSGPWLDYHAHFEACAELSAWNYNQRGLYLAVSLRGNAQGVLGNMPKGAKPDYLTLVKALEDRFEPPGHMDIYRAQMRERRQTAGESLPELGQAIRRLANLAYPTATAEIRETLSKDQFVDALVDSEMRIRIKQARPRNLNEAIQLAVELEAYTRAEKTNYARSTITEPVDCRTASALEELSAKVEALQTEIRELKAQRNERSPRVRQKLCYFCRKPGHVRKDCKACKVQRIVNTNLTKVGLEHREHREKLTFKCSECDYVFKRERDLKRHAETRHRADSRDKTDLGEMDNKGKGPGNLHELIGMVRISKKAVAAGERENSVDYSTVFELPRKVCRTAQGDAPGSSKMQLKSPAGDCRKLISVDNGKPKKMVSTCTQTHGCCGQAGSTEFQTEKPDSCDRGIQASPVKKLTRLSLHRDNNQKMEDRGRCVGPQVAGALVTITEAAK